MTESGSPVALDYAVRCPKRGRLLAILTPPPSVGWFFIGGPICAVLLSFLPHASMCDAIGIGMIFCGISLPLADWAVLRRSCGGKRLWTVRVGAMLVVVAISSLLFVDSADQIFRRAFAVNPPAGVRDLVVRKRYAGGPGDIVVSMRFRADRATVDALVIAGGLVPDPATLQMWKDDQDWKALCHNVFGFGSEYGSGSIVPAMSDPLIFESRSTGGIIEHTNLLWDAATGDAYVQYSAG